MSRIEILEASLRKKEAEFDASLSAHIADVCSSNGQPLNDKRNGFATIRRWERQDESLRKKKEGIEKTKEAIARERRAIARVQSSEFPDLVKELIDSGKLTIWRKFPKFIFVNGVEKARIKYDKGKFFASYYSELPECEYAIFMDMCKTLNSKLREKS